jgi:chromosome segregation ATPase
MTAILGILAGVLGTATVLLLWRFAVTTRQRYEARRGEDAARQEAERKEREARSAREELETKRRELADVVAERNDLKKKLFDAKGDAKRQAADRARREEDERDTRYRELLVELKMAREDLAHARKQHEDLEKEAKALREKVQGLESQQARRAPAREERKPPEPGSAEEIARDLQELKRKLAERDRALETLRRKADNANRIYVVTKSQLDLAQEKIANLGLRYAEVLAKLEGRPPPMPPPEPSPAADAAAEAEALAAASDETEPGEAQAAPASEGPAAPRAGT